MRRYLVPVLLLSLCAAGCAAGTAPAAKPSIPGIAPLDRPPLVRAKAATDLKPEEPVLGVSVGGDARAYPLRALAGHLVANDTFEGTNVAVAWCRPCDSFTVLRTDTPKGKLTLAASGRFVDGDQLLVDRETGTLWRQLTGTPVEGPLAGSGIRLEPVPLVVTTWGNWTAAIPETRVVQPEADATAEADLGAPAGPLVFGVVVNGAARAYPLGRLKTEGIINDELGGRGIVIVAEGKADPYDRTVRVYERGDRTFSRSGRTVFGLVFLNDQNGRAWRSGEESLVLPDNTKLPRLPGFVARPEAWAAAHPGG